MVHLVISTDNEAFQNGAGGSEVARILRRVADEAEAGKLGTYKLHDCNGNTVGRATVSGIAP